MPLIKEEPIILDEIAGSSLMRAYRELHKFCYKLGKQPLKDSRHCTEFYEALKTLTSQCWDMRDWVKKIDQEQKEREGGGN